MNLTKLIEAFLLEAAALTKGSQRVMADKKLVQSLAATVRDDAAINPSAFPTGSKNNFKKATDEAVAQWFLENIDQIEREGYEGTVYSRDGTNSDWIVRRYIAGSHTWEDLTGVMNMNLRDWYLLKNRNLLDTNHKDLSKFKSVRDVGFYMTTHYKGELEKVRDAAKNAARNKMAKNFKLVDNDDYRIYTAINRAAGCALGLGTQWCTANSNYGGHFHSYSGKAMLFQLFPYVTKKNAETGEEELGLSDTAKYQFDAGGPTFMDITDRPVPATKVRETFPYIFTDLATALKKNKSKMEKAFEEWTNDATLQHEDFKIKSYEIDEEIQKLHKFVDRGYFTDEVRPSETSADDAGSEQPQIGAEPTRQEQPPQEPQMETIKQLAKAMLEDKTLGHVVQQYKPLNKSGEDSPMTYGDENLDETNNESGLAQAKQGLLAALAARAGNGQQAVGEDDAMMQGPAAGGDIGAQAATGGPSGAGGGGGGGGGGQYPPGTAPTMPESIETDEGLLGNIGSRVKGAYNSYQSNRHLNKALSAQQKGDTAGEEQGYAKSRMHGDKADAERFNRKGDWHNTDMSMPQQQKRIADLKAKGLVAENNQEKTMENVDKDVAAMMASLKKYDKLNESVLGMVTLSMAKPKVAEDTSQQRGQANDQKRAEDAFTANRAKKRNDSDEAWAKSQGKPKVAETKRDPDTTPSEWDDEEKEANDTAELDESSPDKSKIPAAFRKEKGGDWKTSKADLDKDANKSPTTKKGLEDKKEKEGIKESSEVDPEILDWMKRFSKLGNMKGYGR